MSFPILRFLVRDFVYDEQALEAGKNEITKLESDKKKQFVSSYNEFGMNWLVKNNKEQPCSQGPFSFSLEKERGPWVRGCRGTQMTSLRV